MSKVQTMPVMRKFEILSGVHNQDGKLYRSAHNQGKPAGAGGDIVPAQHDLAAQFVNKFREVDSSAKAGGIPVQQLGQPVIPPSKVEEVPDADDNEDPVQDAAERGAADVADPNALGKDVTATFPNAAEQAFKVFKRTGKYFVYDEDELDRPLTAGLTKAEVPAAIQAALKGK